MSTETTEPKPALRAPRPGAAVAANTRLRQALGRLRRSIYCYLTLECLAWLAVTALALAVVSFALDYFVKMTVPQRGLILGVSVFILCLVVVRWLWRPLRHKIGDEDLALVLEDHFPHLEDRIITTLQLASRTKTAAELSPQLVDAVAEEALERIETISVTEPLNRRRLRKRLLYGGAAIGIFVLAWLVAPNWMNIWLQRNVLLQKNVEWPHNTYLTVFVAKESGLQPLNEDVLRLGRGSDLEIVIKASGRRIPQQVRLDLSFAGSGRFREVIERGEGDQFIKKSANIVEPFAFTVAGGDYRTREFRVEVVTPPDLTALDFYCEYPAYTGLKARHFGAAEGGLDAVVGTWVTVKAAFNKPLRGGRLLLNGQPIGELRLQDGKQVEGRWQLRDAAKDSGKLTLKLTDVEGFESDAYSYPITALPDRPPTVKLQTKGIGDRITPNARVPLEIEAADDFGITQTLIVHRLRDNEKSTTTMGLKDAPSNRKQFTYTYPWEVEPLDLKPGQVLSFRAEALDAADGKGISGELALRVVKREELLDDMRRQQKLYSLELERIIKRQRETTTATMLSRDRLRANPNRPVAEEKQPLQEIIAGERDVGNALKNLSDQIARLTNEMENNRLAEQAEYDHWRAKVAAPLSDVSKQVLGSLVTRVGEGQTAAQSADAVIKLAAAISEQEAAEARLELIRGEMSIYAEWNVIVETLRRILDEAKATQKSLDEEFIKRIREILGGPGR